MIKKMKILVACEESQAVTKELRKLGHAAYSCDILDCSGGHKKWHIRGDVLKVVKNGWDMMIAFPPCTHLAVSGARHFEAKIADGRQQEAIDFFMALVNAPIDKIAIENPVGIMSVEHRKPDQIIHPYYFGDEAQKRTCLWLKNLPLLYHNEKANLFDEDITHVNKGEFITFESGKKMPKWYSDAGAVKGLRSKTFPGIARAMAQQWGRVLE
jgi:site-specific DNA-cytosine methylase